MPEAVAPALQFCWLLFLVSKGRLLPPSPDLVSAFSLLVCVIGVAVAHTNLQTGAIEALLRGQEDAEGPGSVLHALALVHKANWPSVKVHLFFIRHSMHNTQWPSLQVTLALPSLQHQGQSWQQLCLSFPASLSVTAK